MFRGGLFAVLLLGLGVVAGAVDPLPDDLRVAARVVGHLEVPPDPPEAAPPDADHPGMPPMRMPTDVAVDSLGRVFVADGVNNRVLVFDGERTPAGLRLNDAGTVQHPSSSIQHPSPAPKGAPRPRPAPPITAADGVNLSRPTGLTVDARDRLWIADTANRRVVVVADAGRELVEVIPLPQAHSDIPVDATDVAVSPDGARLYVVDNDNHRLLVRDNRSGEWTTIGQRGRALGQMQWPFQIAVEPTGRLYVTEAVGGRVQRFAADGRAERAMATWGLQAGQVYRPKGVAADRAGRVFVSDSTTGAVQAVAPTGELLGVLCGPDGRPIRFDHPMGLAVGPGSVLYVVELKSDRVAIVSLSDSKLAPVHSPTTQPDRGSAK